MAVLDAGLEFEFSAAQLVLERLLALPEPLRPTRQSFGEDEAGVLIGDAGRFLREFRYPVGGFYLISAGATFDIREIRNGRLICHVFFGDISFNDIREFLIHMAVAKPIFGFACATEERKQRNRITTVQGVNTIESWVGRDTQRYIPGLYWWTFLPASLAEKHGVPLPVIASVALEHIELEEEKHLFRFYENPDDWRLTTVVAGLCSSLPGIFDVEKIRPQLEGARTFLEYCALADAWE